jgi:energy-coupling factor transport system substrate-specific component
VNPIAWVQGLEGLTLAAVICAFLFVEEIGVPLPFAPGDLLLAIAGIAIAAGRVQPVVMVGMASLAIVAGAMLGRELFALLGWRRLMKVAEPLHARVPLERASQMLERNGWRAVFTARLIPGLRVHTTQVAGVSGMPRLSFLAGLLPATAVYVGAFVGLGVAFGRPILAIIHQAERQVLVLAVALVAGIVIMLWLRSRARRALESLGGWSGAFKVRLGSPGIALIPICIGLNFATHTVAVGLKLPLFGDTIGTVLSGVLAGPWVGASVGLLTNLVSSNTVDPIAAPYSVVSVAIGFAAGLGRDVGRQRRLGDWLALWAICFLIASVVSTPLNILVSGGRSGVPLGDAIYAYLLGTRLPGPAASFLAEAAIDLPDKLITVLAAMLIFRSLPLPAPERSRLELDVGLAFTFPFHSRGWLPKLLVCALCALFFWLLVPLLLLVGYSVAVARCARQGEHELPPWNHPGEKLKDGFGVIALLLIWMLPGVLLGLPAELAPGTASGGGAVTMLATGALQTLAALGGLWELFVLVAQAALWAQYLQGGFGAALNVAAVFRRIKFHAGLTIVVGALTIVLWTLALSGLIVVLLGALVTFPYASWVCAHLFGKYSEITDSAVTVGGRSMVPA